MFHISFKLEVFLSRKVETGSRKLEENGLKREEVFTSGFRSFCPASDFRLLTSDFSMACLLKVFVRLREWLSEYLLSLRLTGKRDDR
jgi:hypothetical protein